MWWFAFVPKTNNRFRSQNPVICSSVHVLQTRIIVIFTIAFLDHELHTNCRVSPERGKFESDKVSSMIGYFKSHKYTYPLNSKSDSRFAPVQMQRETIAFFRTKVEWIIVECENKPRESKGVCASSLKVSRSSMESICVRMNHFWLPKNELQDHCSWKNAAISRS